MTQGHPTRLWWYSIIFAIQMGCYGLLLTNLLPFSRDALQLGEDHAILFFAAFASLSYVIAIAGGLLCDYFGFKSATIIGLICTFISFQLLSNTHSIHLLYIASSLFIVSQGLTASSIPALVSLIYQKGDNNHTAGTTLFYLIFNIGALCSIFSSGFLVEYIDYFHMFFYLSFVVLLALIIFIFINTHEAPTSLYQHIKNYLLVIIFSIIFTGISYLLISHPSLNNYLIFMLTIGSLIYLYLYGKALHDIKKRIHALITFCIIAIFFYVAYSCMFNLLPLFAKYAMNLSFFGFTLHENNIEFFDGFYVIVLGTILTVIWRKLANKNIHISFFGKLILGVIFSGLAYLVFAAIILTNIDTKTSAYWFLILFFFLTLGELLVMPTGFAMINQLVPQNKVGLCIGIWTLMSGVSPILAGFITTFNHIDNTMPLSDVNKQSATIFIILGGVIVIAGAISYYLFHRKMAKL